LTHVYSITELVEDDPLFTLIYSELYFRHLFSVSGGDVALQLRLDAWGTYTALFDLVLSGSNYIYGIILPDEWTYDILDEFVYQWQSFSKVV
jgi:translation initiation factor 3 subunit L